MLYADDLILFESDPTVLQQLLGLLYREYFHTDLDINVAKTIHSIFYKTQARYPVRLHAGTTLFPLSANFIVNLGGVVQYNGTLKPHIDAKFEAALRVFGAVLYIWKCFPHMTISYKLTLWDSLVYSVAHYVSNVCIWDNAVRMDWFEAKLLCHSCVCQLSCVWRRDSLTVWSSVQFYYSDDSRIWFLEITYRNTVHEVGESKLLLLLDSYSLIISMTGSHQYLDGFSNVTSL